MRLNQVLDEQILPDGITLSRELTAGVEVSLDPDRFQRVIINLFDNAYQAMLEWDKANDKPLVLNIRSEVVNQQLKISISDTGPGIPPEVRPHIFEPLYSTKGFGVGLAFDGSHGAGSGRQDFGQQHRDFDSRFEAVHSKRPGSLSNAEET